MLRSLHVKNLALIDEVEVEFETGLNILTGETGAGKSIILGSVNLALGGRYNADILRHGAEYGFVELVFWVQGTSQIEQLKGLDVFPEEGQIILSRRLMESRSVSKINGESVSIGRLKEVAGILIDIHGQHEHQSLLYKKNHLTILDEYAKDKVKEAKKTVAIDYEDYKVCKAKLDETGIDEIARKREVSLLEFEVKEIEESNLEVGEDERLEAAYQLMINGKKIVESAQEAYGFTGADAMQNASDMLSRAIRSLQEAANYDMTVERLLSQLIDVDSLLNDFNRELVDYSKSFEFSSEDFQCMQERLNEINRLKAKYGNSVEEILEYSRQKEERLSILLDYDAYKEKLMQDLKVCEKKLKFKSEQLHQIRMEYATDLEKIIRQGLLELNFLDVKFEIAFHELQRYTAEGTDEVEFMVSMNPGEPVKPLSDVASGGELSRMMLAIKAVLADKDDIGTLIFDEIDVGISGRTAQKVSEKMAVIGKSHQVICITHLAQIAAMADAHFVIEKTVEQQITKTNIRILTRKDSVEELARIIGGAQITDTILKSAFEMKELAERTK